MSVVARVVVPFALLACALAACAGTGAGAATGAGAGASGGAAEGNGEVRDVAQIHRARCGACHVRVEPKTRTRAQLEAAFARHRRRVRMTEEEWSRMIDYLASDPKESE